MTNTADIRQTMKQRRSELSGTDIQLASSNLTEQLLKHLQLQPKMKLGAYLAMSGEIELRSVIEQAWQLGVAVYLPILCTEKDRQLWFAPYYPDSEFSENRFGIAEPIVRTDELILPDALDLALVPLVAFDEAGHRIGMGGGFYDSSFQSVRETQQPSLIGCAYEFQKVDQIDVQPWDVDLHAVATDENFYNISKMVSHS